MEAKFNLYVTQGVTFSYPLTITDDAGNPIDLTSATARAQMRTGYRATTGYDFVCTTGANGYVELKLPYTLTATIPDGRYVFDAFYYNAGEPIRFLEGVVTVMPSVTK